MTALISFETERLCLRQWRTSDLKAFAALNADPRVMAFFPAPLDQIASDAVADRCHALIAERGWGFWAAESKSSGEFIGFVGLNVPIPALPFSPCVEVGWRLAHACWGKGFATEAANGALRVGFERLGLAEIVAFTAVCNSRSISVMRRLGMIEAPANFDHPVIAHGSPLRRHCLYRLSRERWLSTRRAIQR